MKSDKMEIGMEHSAVCDEHIAAQKMERICGTAPWLATTQKRDIRTWIDNTM
jgi:hypothetical protein